MALQESYFGQTTAKEQDKFCIEVQGKLDDASQWVNATSVYYELMRAS